MRDLHGVWDAGLHVRLKRRGAPTRRSELKPPYLHVVLVEPEIHTNTGNIGRLCVAAGAALHLIEPLGFEITDARLKRAALDYWPLLQWHRYPDYASFEEVHARRGGRTWLTSGRGERPYDEVAYEPGDAIVFGRESVGLPADLLRRDPTRTVRIPIRHQARSLNLAHAAGIVVFEALRQLRSRGLEIEARHSAAEQPPSGNGEPAGRGPPA